MHFRTHYRLHAVPMTIIAISASLLAALVFVQRIVDFLGAQLPSLPLITMITAIALPVAVIIWYALSFAEVHRGILRLRSLRGRSTVDLRSLVEIEVYERGRVGDTGDGGGGRGAKRRAFNLLMRLQDSSGSELWLPLNAWQDEDLLLALILRATVSRKVTIGGDPAIVRRFSSLIESYRSWDRQQAA